MSNCMQAVKRAADNKTEILSWGMPQPAKRTAT